MTTRAPGGLPNAWRTSSRWSARPCRHCRRMDGRDNEASGGSVPPAPDAPATLDQIGRWSSSFVGPAPEREYLLRHKNGGFMPAGKLCLLASPGGKGKTALLMHLAIHVAAGRPWLGLDVVKPGAVAMVLGEEDAEEVHRRLNASCGGSPPPPNVLVLPLAGHGSRRLVDDAGVTEHFYALRDYLVKSAPEGGWRLVIVDPSHASRGRRLKPTTPKPRGRWKLWKSW